MSKVCFGFSFFKKIKVPESTQIFNLYCILLAFSLKDSHLKILSTAVHKHTEDVFYLRPHAEAFRYLAGKKRPWRLKPGLPLHLPAGLPGYVKGHPANRAGYHVQFQYMQRAVPAWGLSSPVHCLTCNCEELCFLCL